MQRILVYIKFTIVLDYPQAEQYKLEFTSTQTHT